jgi:hypothetical protein
MSRIPDVVGGVAGSAHTQSLPAPAVEKKFAPVARLNGHRVILFARDRR